jgi:hypothetical protein
VFLFGWFGTLLVWTRWSDNWITRREPPVAFLQTVAAFVLGVALLGVGNTNVALRDFDQRVIPWHLAMQHREAMLTAAESEDLVVPQTPPTPNIFFDADISQHQSLWQNQAVAKCYGLSSVRIESDLERLLRVAERHAPETETVR